MHKACKEKRVVKSLNEKLMKRKIYFVQILLSLLIYCIGLWTGMDRQLLKAMQQLKQIELEMYFLKIFKLCELLFKITSKRTINIHSRTLMYNIFIKFYNVFNKIFVCNGPLYPNNLNRRKTIHKIRNLNRSIHKIIDLNLS